MRRAVFFFHSFSVLFLVSKLRFFFSLLKEKKLRMLSACGITSFLTPLPACCNTKRADIVNDDTVSVVSATPRCATGEIKATPEDFVVVEVDPTGQRTDAHLYTFPAAEAATPATRIHPQNNDEAAGVAGEGDEDLLQRVVVGGTNNTFPEIRATVAAAAVADVALPPLPRTRSAHDLHRVLLNEAPTLRAMFGSAAEVGAKTCTTTFTQADLTALIRDVQLSAQGALPLSPPSVETSPDGSALPSPVADAAIAPLWWRGRHCLGEFADRKERQVLHLLVRRCFPHLRTYAEVPNAAAASSSPEAASVISCSLDLHYVLFSATLGTEAARCIARWAVVAQAARQERSLDDNSRRELRSVEPVEDAVAPASVEKGVCFASFDQLTEVMHRPLMKSLSSDDLALLGDQALQVSGATTSRYVSRGQAPLLSDKDVRRHVHDVLRRFYPFIRCQVRDGQVVLRYTPKSSSKAVVDTATVSCASSLLSSHRGVAPGVRRPREDEEEEAVGRAAQCARDDVAMDTIHAGFLHFIVRKRNLDTAELRQLLGEFCGLNDGATCVAGMKDKKAVTTQRCSIPLASPTSASRKAFGALAAATAEAPVVLRWPADPQNSYAAVLCAASRSAPVHLGQLEGNCFSVRVRGVRWATEAEKQSWHHHEASQATSVLVGKETETTGVCVPEPASDEAALRLFLEERFRRCVDRGFVNYFGQQRFGETIEQPDDHTGVHLFAGRWVQAVKSLFRACPDVYDAFPEKMEARFVPGNSRDAQVMTHALRQTYRMCFSEYVLTRNDVQTPSELWTRLCERAITDGVAYFLRSLWVHAGQSVFFNLAASFIVGGMEQTPLLSSSTPKHESYCCEAAPAATAVASQASLPPLSYATVAKAYLPLGGSKVKRTELQKEEEEGKGGSGGDDGAVWQMWQAAAVQHALHTLRWTRAQAFEQRKVAGVPVPGSWRAVVVRPQDAALQWEAKGDGKEACAMAQSADTFTSSGESALPSMRLSFTLPSSSYATIFLREVLGCDKWW